MCRIGAEQSNATKSKATKSKAKKSKANQRRLSVCLSMSYPQTTTTSGIRVACTFRPIRPASPRSSSLRLSSPLLSLCVGQKQSKARQRKAKQRKAKQRKAKKSKANQRRLSVWLSVSYPQTTTTSGMRVACTFRPIRPSSPRLALPLFSSPLFFYLCVCRI